ncbi:MAG: ABC transporter ATP-binding protein [Firmicutes bacterium]|nr:ABC transporter ATP-binding protein [Bacillota bacterium]
MKFVIKDVVKSYGKELPVLDGASFEFEEGKIYGLLGRNGSGKTTLFNCISGDIPYNYGEFYIVDDAGNVRNVEPDDIGYVLSTPNVPEFLTGREFLKFFLDINKEAGSIVDAEKYFELVRLSGKDADKLMKNYSHGMKNKMQMLVNMLAKPNLFLLDEPLTSLDVVVSEEMKELLRGFKEGRITIFSTHILDLAVDLCDEIVLLSKGRLEAVDHAALDNEGFKERIIELLKDEEGDTNV